MEIVVHSKKSVSTKASKKLYLCNRNSQLSSAMQRMIQLDFRSRTKNSTPSVVRTPTPHDSATLQKQGLLATYTTQNVWPLHSTRKHYLACAGNTKKEQVLKEHASDCCHLSSSYRSVTMKEVMKTWKKHQTFEVIRWSCTQLNKCIRIVYNQSMKYFVEKVNLMLTNTYSFGDVM